MKGIEPSLRFRLFGNSYYSYGVLVRTSLNGAGCYANVLCIMASVHVQPGRPFYFAAYTLPNGQRAFRSTKTRNKRQAEEVARAWAKAARKGRKGVLTPDSARIIIAEGVADAFCVATGDRMPQNTVREWAATWLKMKAIETEPSTHERYEGVVDRFIKFLGAKADRDLVTIQPEVIAKLRDEQVTTLSRASANLAVKILRGLFATALKRGLITSNPALAVDVLKQRGETNRRPFTVAEVKRLIAAADTEWRGLILFGLYTGQRLGDLASLTWSAIKMGTSTQDSEVAFQTQKTGRRMVLPLVSPLFDYLSELPASDSPDAPLFPRVASAASTATLSNQFRQLLVSVGMAEKRPHRSTGKGRNTTRERAEISFHCLRHTATTLLKAAGVSNSMAMDIIGHDTEAISRTYTHFNSEDLRRSIEKLPDIRN